MAPVSLIVTFGSCYPTVAWSNYCVWRTSYVSYFFLAILRFSDIGNEWTWHQSLFLTLSCFVLIYIQSKTLFLLALISSASAFAPSVQTKLNTQLYQEKPEWEKAAELGWSVGGEDYTREVKPQTNEDPRKSIPQGESFEEYMKSRK